VIGPGRVQTPVRRGEKLGEIRVYDGKRLVARRPLVAAEALSDPSLRRRVGWYAGRALHEARDMLGSLSPF